MSDDEKDLNREFFQYQYCASKFRHFCDF